MAGKRQADCAIVLADIRARLDRILRADGRTPETVEHEVHSIASSAATFGARRLELAARALERDCRLAAGLDAGEVDIRLAEIDRLAKRTCAAYPAATPGGAAGAADARRYRIE